MTRFRINQSTNGRINGPKGITLTEVLVSIMVMGIGLLALFTLFPIGLLNLQRAVSLNRSTFLGRNSPADLKNQNLMHPSRYRIGVALPPSPATLPPPSPPASSDPTRPPPYSNNPFVRDWLDWTPTNPAGGPALWEKEPGDQEGLPVAIDPTWILLNPSLTPIERRLGRMDVFDNATLAFGPDGLPDPNADGLQRVIPTNNLNDNPADDAFVDAGPDSDIDGVPDIWPDATALSLDEFYLSSGQTEMIFSSPDDLAYQENDPALPVVDSALGSLVRGRNYTWMITAQLAPVPTVAETHNYQISVVTFFNRDFANEQVVAAIYLPDPVSNPNPDPTDTSPKRGAKQVLLRWPVAGQAPRLPNDGWILDATYDGNPTDPATDPNSGFFGPHRAIWYHVIERGQPRAVDLNGDGTPDEMRMILTLEGRVRFGQTTPLANWGPEFNVVNGFDDDGDGLVDELDEAVPAQVNVAVIIPGVISVYEETIAVTP